MYNYMVAIEPGDDIAAYGAVVPDLPGCFSAGDTLDEVIENTLEAVSLWLEDCAEEGRELPKPQPMASHYLNPEFQGWIWHVVMVDEDDYTPVSKKINITVPAHALTKIDRYVAKNPHLSRSSFFVQSALEAMKDPVNRV